MKEIDNIQPKYFDEMSKIERNTLYKEYNAINHHIFLLRILKNKVKFFNWLKSSKCIYKNKEDEWFDRIKCEEFGKQYKIIRDCVQRAVCEWILTELEDEYTIENFESVCFCVSNDINSQMIIGREIDSAFIGQSITANYYDEFDDEILANSFSKIAAQILQNLSVSLLKKERFVLPEYLWSYWIDYTADYKKKQIIERLKEGLILENPLAIIPWNTTPIGAKKMLGQHGLKKITEDYYSIKAMFLDGLDCIIGLHFGIIGIKFFEIFKDEEYYKNNTIKDSYNEIQEHIERVFGEPILTRKASDVSYDAGFDSHTWKVGERTIIHYVFERFGPEEHFHIER